MSQHDQFERVLDSLHEAMLDDAHWPSTSALIDEACRSKGNMLVFGDGGVRDDLQVFFARFCFRGQRYVEGEREYFDVYHPLDERVPRLRKLPDSRLAHVDALYTDDEMKKSLVYNELLPRSNAGNGVHVRLDGPDGSRIMWSLADPVDDGGWWSGQLEMFERLLPHIRQFVRMRHVLVESGALKTTLGQLLDNTRAGVIQLDRHGRIVAANDRASELLREADVLSDQDHELRASSPEDNAELQRLLGRALSPFGAQGESGSMVMKRTAGSASVVLHVTPVEDRQLDFRTWRAAALVLVVDPKKRVRIDRRMVSTALGLSPPESEVAASLAEGHSVPDIARAIGRGESTVRWHIKQSFSKLGINRQAQLVQLVTAVGGVLPPRG